MNLNIIYISVLSVALMTLVLLLIFFKIKKDKKNVKFVTNALHHDVTIEMTVEVIIYFSLLISFFNDLPYRSIFIAILLLISIRSYFND